MRTEIPLRERDGDAVRALAYRSCPVIITRDADAADLPPGVRDFRLAISTDEPIKRGDITEVLVHESIDNFELSRLDKGAMNILNGHASFFGGGDPFGTFQPGTARVEDGELIINCRLVDDGALGTAQIARWDAGICTTLSIGYEWLRHEKVTDADGVDTGIRRVLKTKIYECSLVGVPADPNAQLRDAFAEMLKRSTQTRTEDPEMKPAERNPADDTPATDPTPTPEPTRDDTPTPTPTPEPTPTPALPAGEAERAFAYAAAMRDGAAQRATQWVDGFLRDADSARRDKARDDIETAIRDTAGRLAAARESERQPEVDALSVRIGKIIHAAQTGNRPPPRATDAPTTRDTGEPGMRSLLVRQAEFEREAGADAPPMSAGTAIVALAGGAGSLTQKESASVLARHRELTDDILGRCTDSVREHIAPLLGGPMSPRGIMLLPSDFVRYGLERQRRIDKQMGRAQTAAAADNKGDSLVSTDVLVDEYIEGLYASSKLYEAGATVMAGLTSLKQIPVQSSNLDADFYAETGKIPNVDFGIGHVTLEPHRIGIANPSTLLIQILSGGAIGRWQMYNVMAALDNGQEGAFLNGNGAGNNPRGLRNTNGIDVVAIGTNGGNITVAKLAEPMTEIKKDNIFPDGKFTALLTPDTLTYGQSRARFGTGGDNFIIPEDLMRARYRILESNLLPTNLTKGTGTNLHAAAFGNFGDFFIATFGMPTVTFDDLTMIDSGQTRIVVNTFVDCVLARKESIKLMNDISVA